MKKHVLLTPTLLFIILIIETISFAQSIKNFDNRLLEFDKDISNLMIDDSAGMSVIITYKDQIIYEKYTGYANFDNNERLNANHVLGIASMSKQFLGMATLFLVEDDEIDLGADIRKYFPELPLGNESITVKQLLTHTSGLPELTQNDVFMSGISDSRTIDEIIKLGLKGDFRSKPGEKFLYCNTGYTIITALVEKQSGMTYSDFLDKNIFQPLNMENTYSCEYNKDATNAVQRYMFDSTGYHNATVMHFSNLIGGGGIVSNVRDMAKWNISLLTGENLPHIYEQLWEPVLLNSGESTGYGLGIGNNEHKGHQYYYHPGMGDGMNSVNLIFPDKEITITVIRNVFPPKVSSNEIALMAAEYLFND